MRKITFYIGLQDKDTKTELIKYDEACKIIANRLDMFTIQRSQGCYQYNDGSVCFENTLIVTNCKYIIIKLLTYILICVIIII